MIEKLTDIFSEELKLPKVLVRPQVAKLLDRLSAEGIHLTDGAQRVSYLMGRKPVEPAGEQKYFCPHCGAHAPRLWIQPALSELPAGTAASFALFFDYMVIACGECHSFLAISAVGMRPKDPNSVGKVQG